MRHDLQRQRGRGHLSCANLAVVSCQRLELDTKSEVAADGEAILAGHGDDGGAIVLENLRGPSLALSRRRLAQWAATRGGGE